MAVAWREFELLVARIEQTVTPQGAKVESPDRVRDLLTGSMREVDATIRYKIGTVPILITVECRKHANVQDDMWIEQLAMKREKVGAAKTIAVSAAGFTEPAKTTARMKGIEVRTIEEITTADIADWLRIDGIELLVDFSEVVSLRIGQYDTPADIHPDVVTQMRQDSVGAPIFMQVGDVGLLSIRDVFTQARTEGGWNLHEGIPEDGTRVRRDISITFPRGSLSVQTVDGPRFVHQLSLGVDVWLKRTQMPLPDGFDYSDTETSMLRGFEYRPDIPGHDAILTVCREDGSHEIKLNMLIRKKPDEGLSG